MVSLDVYTPRGAETRIEANIGDKIIFIILANRNRSILASRRSRKWREHSDPVVEGAVVVPTLGVLGLALTGALRRSIERATWRPCGLYRGAVRAVDCRLDKSTMFSAYWIDRGLNRSWKL